MIAPSIEVSEMIRRIIITILFLSSLLAGGCIWLGREVVEPPSFNVSRLGRVAVLPFKNNTVVYNAGNLVAGRIRRLLIENADQFEVANINYTALALDEGSLAMVDELDSHWAQEMGEKLNVDSLIAGTVASCSVSEIKIEEWYNSNREREKILHAEKRAWISVRLRAIDAETGGIIWGGKERFSLYASDIYSEDEGYDLPSDQSMIRSLIREVAKRCAQNFYRYRKIVLF